MRTVKHAAGSMAGQPRTHGPTAPRPPPPAQRASLAAVVAVGFYDLLQTQRLAAERATLTEEHRSLTRTLATGADGNCVGAEAVPGSGGAGGGAAEAAFDDD